MLRDIITAEVELEKLLPPERLVGPPGKDLLKTAVKWSDLVWQEAVKQGPTKLSYEQLSKGLKLLQRPVFICGVHRSGTTLVQNLLDGHPQLLVLPSEGTFFTNLEFKLKQRPKAAWAQYLGTEWLRRMVNPINQPPYFLLGRSKSSGSPYVEFARYVIAWWEALAHIDDTQWPHSAIVLAYASCTNNLSALHWVDKTPTNELFLNRIWKEFPGAKILHIVRDPMATLTSRKVMEPAITLRQALRFLKISYGVATDRAMTNDPRFFLLRYEDLCNNADDSITHLAGFLEIKNTPQLKQATTAGMPIQANSSFDKNIPSGAILKVREQSPREVFSKEEKKAIAAYVGKEAVALGYFIDKLNSIEKAYARFRYVLFS